MALFYGQITPRSILDGWQRVRQIVAPDSETRRAAPPVRGAARHVFAAPVRLHGAGATDRADCGRHRLVVAPHLNVLTLEQATALERYVRGGGHLLLGPRSGMKDAANALRVLQIAAN